jgi:predicted NodU family carbamoyl transferase
MDEAVILVADGRGSNYILDNGKQGHETISVYFASIEHGLIVYIKDYNYQKRTQSKSKSTMKFMVLIFMDAITLKGFENFDVDHRPVSGAFYSRMTNHLGFKTNDEGKLNGIYSLTENLIKSRKNFM